MLFDPMFPYTIYKKFSIATFYYSFVTLQYLDRISLFAKPNVPIVHLCIWVIYAQKDFKSFRWIKNCRILLEE